MGQAAITAETTSVFHAYDIRGVYGEELDEGLAYLIGRAVVVHLDARTVLVGHDMRPSSIPLRDALVRGIRDQGADVVDIGLCSTPMFYWTTADYPAGVMVTASHNPAKYNGIKVCRAGVQPVGETTGLKDIERLVLDASFPPAEGQGSYHRIDVLDTFLKHNLSFLKTDKPFKVVVDAGNGMGGYTYDALLKILPKSITIIPMYFEPDGTFPNHEANPVKVELLKALQERVMQEGADFGLALDGDEDRLAVIDNEGRYVPNDLLLAALAQHALVERPGAAIVCGVQHSRATFEAITAAGGKPVISRVGHAFVMLAMEENDAALGAELSGHFYNPEQRYTENTQLVLFKLLNLLSQDGQTMAQMMAPLRRYAKTGEVNFESHAAHETVRRLDELYSPQAKSVSRVDGIRVEFDEWWFSVRASNTEPLVRLVIEARDETMLAQRLEELRAAIAKLSA